MKKEASTGNSSEFSIANLQGQGFVRMHYPDALRRTVEKAVRSWQQFCLLPEPNKANFGYDKADGGFGYQLKEGDKATFDRKENFHYMRRHDSDFSGMAAKVGVDASVFVHDIGPVIDEVRPLIADFARQAEKNFSMPGLADEVLQAEDYWLIRFIHYFGDDKAGRKAGEETASAHTDRSGFTPHLYASDPGLERLSYDGRWIDMPMPPGETVIIPSMQMQLRSGGALKATCHRVVATEETARTGRYSVVCFVPLRRTPSYNKMGAGRLQEAKPGFNYTMPQADFAKLFV